MLNIEEILKMSEEMGIKISDGSDGKHYIFDDRGERVEFSTNMLMKIDEESNSYKIDMQVSKNSNKGTFSGNYKLVDYKNSYVSKSVNINESIIDAA